MNTMEVLTLLLLVIATLSYIDNHFNTSTFHKSYTKCYLPLAGQYI